MYITSNKWWACYKTIVSKTALDVIILCPAGVIFPRPMVARNPESRHSSVHVHILLLAVYISFIPPPPFHKFILWLFLLIALGHLVQTTEWSHFCRTLSHQHIISKSSHFFWMSSLTIQPVLFFFFFFEPTYISSCTNFKLCWSIKLYSGLWVLTFLLKAELLYVPTDIDVAWMLSHWA